MNVIQIQDLINKIGDLNINMESQSNVENGEEFLESELEIIEELNNDLNHKLLIQLKENSDVELLQTFITQVMEKENSLTTQYHKFRIKLAENDDLTVISQKSISTACKIIDYKLDRLSDIKKDIESKITFFNYKISTDFNENSDILPSQNQNKESLPNSRATFNLSKKESLMLLYILEEVNLLKFEDKTQRKNFIEQNFNFTEVRNNESYGKSFPITDIKSEYSKFNSSDRNELKSNNKTLENLSKKLITIIEEFKFEKK